MAIATSNPVFATVGAAWAAALVEWNIQLNSVDAVTLTAGTTAHFGYHAWFVQSLTAPGNGTLKNFVCLDLPDTMTYAPFAYFLQSPGIRSAQKGWFNTGGSTNIRTLFQNNLLAARAVALETWFGCRPVTYQIQNYLTLGSQQDQCQYLAFVTQGVMVAIDSLIMTYFLGAGSVPLPNTNPPTDGIVSTGNFPIAIGGTLDGSQLIQAVNDVASIDFDYTANNGGAIFSMRGRTNTP